MHITIYLIPIIMVVLWLMNEMAHERLCPPVKLETFIQSSFPLKSSLL